MLVFAEEMLTNFVPSGLKDETLGRLRTRKLPDSRKQLVFYYKRMLELARSAPNGAQLRNQAEPVGGGPDGQVAADEFTQVEDRPGAEATTDGKSTLTGVDPGVVPWTYDLVLASLRFDAEADPDEIAAAAQQRIADRTLSTEARRILADHGYPELAPEPDPDPSELTIVRMADGSSALLGPGDRQLASFERDPEGKKVQAEARWWGLEE